MHTLKTGKYEVDFMVEKSGDRKYIQVSYLLGDKKSQVYQRETRSLQSINDSYEKIILSMDEIQFKLDKGIKHKSLIEFTLE